MENAITQEKLDNLAAYEAAQDKIIGEAKRRVRIFDKRAGPAFNSIQRCQLLRNFLLASRGNRLQIALHDMSYLNSNCPRLLLLLRQFSHAIAIYETKPHAKHVYDPFTVVDDLHYVHRFHHEGSRGVQALNDAAGAREFNVRFEEIWEASFPALSATTLGLR